MMADKIVQKPGPFYIKKPFIEMQRNIEIIVTKQLKSSYYAFLRSHSDECSDKFQCLELVSNASISGD